MRLGWAAALFLVVALLPGVVRAQPAWSQFAGNDQHTAAAPAPSDSLSTIRWSTPTDLNPPSGTLYIHYGSPVITQNNTVIVPVRTGSGSFEVNAINGATGSSEWTVDSDYILPPNPPSPYGWVPVYSPALSPTEQLDLPAAGGTVLVTSAADTGAAPTQTREAFYGISNYSGSNITTYNNNVFIDTPITTDSSGDMYFGFRVTNNVLGAGVTGGIARIAANGAASWVSSSAADPGSSGLSPEMNCAPAIGPNGTLYIAMNNGSAGDLVAVNSTTLAPVGVEHLTDPQTGNRAYLTDESSASVTVGPDGQVYFGVLGNPLNNNHYRGYLLQFNSTLTTEGSPAGFGWDDTASVVPRSMVPQYTGSSAYLLMIKYNNYAGYPGGNGVNQVAIVDPNATITDPITGLQIMKPILTLTGPTPDSDYDTSGYPDAVREWCINSAVVDQATDSILVNSEDGYLYRWDLATDSITQSIKLSSGIGEAYTPTLIGPDGAVYAINDAILDSVVPEPSGLLLAGGAAAVYILTARRRRIPHAA